jgi:ABC-type glutathione transport system ATPase component
MGGRHAPDAANHVGPSDAIGPQRAPFPGSGEHTGYPAASRLPGIRSGRRVKRCVAGGGGWHHRWMSKGHDDGLRPAEGEAIVVRGLTKSFATGRGRRRRTVEAVRDVCFDVAAGERVAYIGPNRAGAIVQITLEAGQGPLTW